MRPLLLGDVTAAARALLAAPAGARTGLATELLRAADQADRYRQERGRLHPRLGNGSLMAAAMARPLAPERRPDDPEFASCLIAVLEAVRTRAAQPLAQDAHFGAAGSRASRASAMLSPQSQQ